MSKSPEAPEELPENLETKVIAQLTVYSSQKDPKGKVKESKFQKKKKACLHIFGQQIHSISSNALGQALTGQIQSYQEVALPLYTS